MPEGTQGDSAPSNESLENILSEFPSEGDQLAQTDPGSDDDEDNDGEDGGDDTAAGSQPGKKQVDEKTPKSREDNNGDEEDIEDDGDLKKEPRLHKHPRFVALTKKNRELEEKLDTALEKLEQIQTGGAKEDEKPGASKSEAPKWFQAMYGDDPELWTEFQDYSQKQQQQIKEKVLEDIQKSYQEAQNADDQAREWVKGQLQSLHDEGLDFKDKELIQVLDEYRPMGDDGNLSFRKAYDILEKLKKANVEISTKNKSNARKEAASKVTSGGGGNPPKGGVDMNKIHAAKDIHELLENQ